MYKKALMIFLGIFASGAANAAFTTDVAVGITVEDEVVSNTTGTTDKAIQTVSGITNKTTVGDYGAQDIKPGGISNDTTVNGVGAQQIVQTGGVANGTTIVSGSQQVFGALHGTTTIEKNGVQILGNGATLNAGSGKISINGGKQYIGMLDTVNGWNDVVNNLNAREISFLSGEQYISNSSSTYGQVIGGGDDKAVQFLSLGGTTQGSFIKKNGVQVINRNSAAQGSSIDDGGLQIVNISSIASATIINGGEQQVFGGLSSVTKLESGVQFLLKGTYLHGVGSSVVINGGIQNIGAEKLENGVIVPDDAIELDATFASSITMNGGTQNVNKGSSITGMTVQGTDATKTGTQNVRDGATATDTLVKDYGVQNVAKGATVTGTIIEGGVQNVANGAIATSTTAGYNGVQNVLNGANVMSTTITNNGKQIIQGTAGDTMINVGGNQTINKATYSNGIITAGTATNTTINGGTQDLLGGKFNMNGTGYMAGTATNTTIQNNGTQNVGKYASAKDTTINRGTQNVNGILKGLTKIQFEGVQNLLTGFEMGTELSDEIQINSGMQNIGDATNHIAITKDVAQKIIMISGTQNVNVGSSIDGMAVTQGTQNVFGTTLNNTVTYAANQIVQVGGNAISSTIKNLGMQTIYGNVHNNTLKDGSQSFQKGSTISGTENYMNGHGVQIIELEANIGDQHNYVTNIEGSQAVHGTINFTRLNGGHQAVNGTSTSTIINNKGQQVVATTGLALDTTINNGGKQEVSGTVGGTTTINVGGNQELKANGVIRNQSGDKVVIAGGTQNILKAIDADNASRIFMTNGVQNINASGSISGMTIAGNAARNGVQYVYGKAENTTVNNRGIQVVTDSTSNISGNLNKINRGGTIMFNTHEFLSDAGSVMTFNGGALRFSVPGNTLYTNNNMLITGNGKLHMTLRSGNKGTDSDYISFGNISGNFAIDLNYDRADANALNLLSSISLIQNGSLDKSLVNFTAFNSGVDIGLYHWDIENDSDIIYAVRSKNVSSMVKNINNHSYAAKDVVSKMSNSMYKRVGELQWLDSNEAFPTQNNGAWVRGIYKQSETKKSATTDISVAGAEFGYDLKLTNSDKNNFYVGALGYITSGDAEFTTANLINDKNDISAYGIGLYAMWLNKDGWFADAALRGHLVSQDIAVYGAGSSTQISFDTSRMATSLNLDFGREFAFQTDNYGMGWFVTPHVQWNMSYITSTDFETSAGNSGKMDSISFMNMSVEVLAGPRWKFRNDSKLQVYGKIGYQNDFSHDLKAQINQLTVKESFSSSQLEFGGGVNYRTANGKTSVYFDLGSRNGSEFSELSGIFGLRFQF